MGNATGNIKKRKRTIIAMQGLKELLSLEKQRLKGIIKLVDRRLKQLDKLTEEYEDNEIEEIYA